MNGVGGSQINGNNQPDFHLNSDDAALSAAKSVNNTTKTTDKGHRRVIYLILLALGVIAVIESVVISVFGVKVMTGNLALQEKDPGDNVVVIHNVCTNDIITSFNKIINNPNRGTDNEVGYKLSKLAKQFTSKSNYNKDATCQYIMYLTNAYNGNLQSAKSNITNLESLAKSGIYPSNSLVNYMSISEIKKDLQIREQTNGLPKNNKQGLGIG